MNPATTATKKTVKAVPKAAKPAAANDSVQLDRNQHLALQMMAAYVNINFDQAVNAVKAQPANKDFGLDLAKAQGLLAAAQGRVGEGADPHELVEFLDQLIAVPVTEWAALIGS